MLMHCVNMYTHTAHMVWVCTWVDIERVKVADKEFAYLSKIRHNVE